MLDDVSQCACLSGLMLCPIYGNRSNSGTAECGAGLNLRGWVLGTAHKIGRSFFFKSNKVSRVEWLDTQNFCGNVNHEIYKQVIKTRVRRDGMPVQIWSGPGQKCSKVIINGQKWFKLLASDCVFCQKIGFLQNSVPWFVPCAFFTPPYNWQPISSLIIIVRILIN